MQALTDKGSALKAKFKKFQKLSILLYALAAISFVFADNIPLMIIFVALDIFLETRLYVCPHCGKGLDCRRKVHDDVICPKCQKYIFRGL